MRLAIASALLVLVVLLLWFGTRAAPDADVARSTAEGATRGTATLDAPLDPISDAREQRAVPPAASETPESSTGRALVVRGRVVDATRRPVAGANVSVRLDPAVASTTLSASDGTFRCTFEPRDRASSRHARVWVTHDTDSTLGAARVVEIATPELGWGFRRPPRADANDIDAGTFVLLPATRASVVLTDGPLPAPGAALDVTFAEGVQLLARFTADAEGVVALPPLPAGEVRFEAAFGERSGTAKIVLPEEPRARVELAPPRVLALHVVDFATGAPLAGARVHLLRLIEIPPPLDPEPELRPLAGGWPREIADLATDANGDVELRLPPIGSLRIDVDAVGHHSAALGGRELLQLASPHWLPLRARSERTVRWPIVAGELPVPPDGTPLAIRFTFGPADFGDARRPLRAGVVADGHVVVEHVSGGLDAVVADTPDGGITSLAVVQSAVLGSPVAFQRARTLEVRVLDARGAPVASARVCGWSPTEAPVTEWFVTGPDGRATMRGITGREFDLRACAPDDRRTCSGFAHADLRAGDASVDVVLPLRGVARVRTLIDGRAQLPARYALDPTARVIQELPETGELRVAVDVKRADAPCELVLRATDFVTQRRTFAPPLAESEPLVVFELERTATIVVDVRRGPFQQLSLGAERFDPEARGWVADRETAWTDRANGAGGAFVFAGLAPGRYRVRDRWSGMSSEEIALRPGQTVRTTLDLGAIGWVTGRVECSVPGEVSRARVVVADLQAFGDTTAWSSTPGRDPPGRALDAGGTFRIAVPLDREITLRAWHHWLAPAKDRGEVRVRGGRDDVVLVLEPATRVRVLVTNTDAGSNFDSLRIAAFRGAVGREPEQWLHALVAGGLAHFGGLAEGTWSFWIEAPGGAYAPKVLERVQLGAGTSELPSFAFERGSWVVVRALLEPGERADSVSCKLTPLDTPRGERTAFPRPDGTHVARGLAAGRHLLRASRSGSLAPPVERELTLDGVHDETIELDLR